MADPIPRKKSIGSFSQTLRKGPSNCVISIRACLFMNSLRPKTKLMIVASSLEAKPFGMSKSSLTSHLPRTLSDSPMITRRWVSKRKPYPKLCMTSFPSQTHPNQYHFGTSSATSSNTASHQAALPVTNTWKATISPINFQNHALKKRTALLKKYRLVSLRNETLCRCQESVTSWRRIWSRKWFHILHKSSILIPSGIPMVMRTNWI